MIQKEFKEILNEMMDNGKISYWTVNSVQKENFNIYVLNDYEVESELKSKRIQSQVTVYKNYDDEIGKSSFTVFESDDREKFEKELGDAIFICSQSKAKIYSLPEKDDDIIDDEHINYEDFYDKKFFEDFESGELENFGLSRIEILRKEIEKSQEKEVGVDVKLNSLEFFNSILRHNVETSSGINKSYKKNSSYFELILTAIDKETGDEKEHIAYENINDIYEYDFEEFFRKNINFVKDTLKAKSLSDFSGKVILSDAAVKDFFVPSPPTSPITNQSDGRLKYLKISHFEVGKEILNAKYDKLTFYSNPLLKHNIESKPCDSLGIASKRLCVIKDNVFMNFYSTKQYADYLNIEATGPLGVVEIERGKKGLEELYSDDDKMIEIVSFAWFSPDTMSGNFSAEIRLGYEIIDGKKIPFRGGLFSGNVFKVLEEVELSKEEVEEMGYLGPKVIKFHKGKIVGLE